MLTPEQIKSLKPGDPLIIHGTYIRKHTDGDIVIKCNVTRSGFLDDDNKYFHPSCVSRPSEPTLPTLKYDPTRLFKKGDKVRYEPKLGRYEPHITNGSICTVLSDERIGRVQIEYCDDESVYSATIPFFFLELVTPVEELEPYKVWDTTFSFNVGVEDSKAVFYYGADMSTCPYTKEQAKAAAEAERDRLNAEWRKEQNND